MLRPVTQCPTCLSTVADGTRFCPNCGTSFAETSDSFAYTGDDGTLLETSGNDSPSSGHPSSWSGGLAAGRFIPGQVLIRRYRIVGLIGRGGMGEVYRADDLKLGQPVALKFLPEELNRAGDALARFLNEVRTARRVTHPNVCRVHDIGEVDGQHFISMEYVDGEDLASLLKRIGRLPQDRAVEVVRQICSGLAAAHEQGILHRDLKPANVMLDGRGRVLITDFGLAGVSEEIRGEELLAGTPAYMAPEQFSGEGTSIRSDLYALGLVMYELFTGKPVFHSHSFEELLRLHRESVPSAPSSHFKGISPAVEEVLLNCLEKDPSDRPSSAQAIADALPGRDPLSAALAAGDTPSPELVAEAGKTGALQPASALGFVLLGVLLFFIGARWIGSHELWAFLPMDKPPAVLIDRAREIIHELGYVEPAYSEPVDTAFGYFVRSAGLNRIGQDVAEPDQWQQLRERPDLLGFWYRQSTQPLEPRSQSYLTFAGGTVSPMNPFPSAPGELSIVLDGSGRLIRFQSTPKRFTNIIVGPDFEDWSKLFELAGLESGRFSATTPRYQRYIAPDRRFAWIGSRAEEPDIELRVEAGSLEHRPALFNVAEESILEPLAADPEPLSLSVKRRFYFNAFHGIIWLISGIALVLARRNILRGRADRLGATRLSIFVGVFLFVKELLQSHSLYGPWGMQELWPIFGSVCFRMVGVWIWYLALEPFGRQTWPSIFVTSSRILSRPVIRWRDPLIGRSVIIGTIAGSLIAMLGPLSIQLQNLMYGVSVEPAQPNWVSLLGQRHAMATVFGSIEFATTSAFFFLVLLVASLYLSRNAAVAVVITTIIWIVILLATGSPGVTYAAAFSGAIIFVLLRFGVLAFATCYVVESLVYTGATTDWTSFYSKAAVFSAILVLAIVIYGYWAATAGKKLFDEPAG